MLVVHHVHLDQFGTYFPAPVARLGRFLEGTLMPRVYRGVTTVAVSDSTRRAMADRLGWREPIVLVYNGNVGPVHVDVPAEDTVDRWSCSAGCRRHKRVDLVIRAMSPRCSFAARPASRHHRQGSRPRRLETLVLDLDVEKHVTFHGFVAEGREGRHPRSRAPARLRVGRRRMGTGGRGRPRRTVSRRSPATFLACVTRSGTNTPAGCFPSPAVDLTASRLVLLVGIERALEELEEPERDEISAASRGWAAQFDWETMRTGAVALVAHP